VTRHDDFFTKGQQIPAVFKHTLLVNYLKPFVAMTAKASSTRTVWYVDGYAGPGTYDGRGDGSEPAAGSPLLALRTAQSLRSVTSPINMRCVFVEANPEHAALLQGLVSQEQFKSIAPRAIAGTVQDHIAPIIADVGGDPLLTFLDPFGTALQWDRLKGTLLSRPKGPPNEVLLNMNVDALRRIGPLLAQEARHQKTLSRVDALLGFTEWRTTFAGIYRPGESGSATRGALAVAAEFRERVLAETGYASIATPVRRDHGHEPIFLMTLFYRHQAALYKFTDAVSLANQKWRLEVAQKEAADRLAAAGNVLWADDLSPQEVERQVAGEEARLKSAWIEAIAANLRELLQKESRIPVATCLPRIYGEALGLARELHLRAALKMLASEGLTAPVTGDLSKVTITRAS
jgi:three-Cys-motif partner protein